MKPVVEMNFAPNEDPDGFAQGHLTFHLDRSVSTADVEQTCMILVAASDLLDKLIAMLGPKKRAEFVFSPTEATRMEVKMQRAGTRIRLSDEHGPIGEVSGDDLLAATLFAAEALAAQCPADPRNAALNAVVYSRRLVVAQFPRAAALLQRR